MSTLYELRQHDGLQIDSMTDEASGLRIQVNRRGAEPISLARRGPDGKWTGFLYRDADTTTPADGWKNHATVMGYYIHRLKDEQSSYRGQPIRGGTHSFLRHKDFAPPGVDAVNGSLVYRIGPGDFTPEEYPLKVQMNLTYALLPIIDKPQLLVTFEFQNLEPELSAHVSFGLHPGFAVNSLADARVILPPGKYLRHVAPGNFLSGETIPIDHPGGPMPFAKADLPGSFILELVDVPDATFVVEDPAGHRRTELDYHEAPYLTLWSDGHDFVCVEPCWGLPDHHDQRPFEQKEGIMEIPPGDRLVRSFTIRPEIMA
jgi:galactose mutarotase-like enzyme